MQLSSYKSSLTALGIAMLLLWTAGLGAQFTTRALTWLDFVAAMLTFATVTSTTAETTKRSRAAGAILLSLGIFGLWIGGLVYSALPWQCWWNFALGAAYLLLGVSTAIAEDQETKLIETIPFRRSA